MPAKAGIQNYLKTLDPCLHGNDVKERFKTFYETIKIKKIKQKIENLLHGHLFDSAAGNP